MSCLLVWEAELFLTGQMSTVDTMELNEFHMENVFYSLTFSNLSLFTSNMFGSSVVSTPPSGALLVLWPVLMPSQWLSWGAADPAPRLQLLQELCTVFNVDLPCRVKSSQLGIISNKQTHTSAIVKPQSSSCSYICQHCLVHLGDIGEFQEERAGAWSSLCVQLLEICLCHGNCWSKWAPLE